MTAHVNSDEPQHLHVIWEWTQGHVQYRDIFDNHAPLFHMFHAPVLELLIKFTGEQAEALISMRLWMLIWYALSLYFTYKIARKLLSESMSSWALMLCATAPWYFCLTSQFRADNLWACIWLATVSFAISAPINPMRALLLGVFIATTFAVSMKSVLLFGAAALAIITILSFRFLLARKIVFKERLLHGFWLLIGASLVVIPVLFFFKSIGALDAFYYGLIAHNHVAHLGAWGSMRWVYWIFPIMLPIVLMFGWRVFKFDVAKARGFTNTFLLLQILFYMILLESYWPLVTDQDFIPVTPLAFIVLLGIVQRFIESRAGGVAEFTLPRALRRAFVVILCFEVLISVAMKTPWGNHVSKFALETNEVLSLSNPDEFVMDQKGETIFRHRPFFYALENITIERLKQGLIKDTIFQSLSENKCGVIRKMTFPPESQAKVESNYLPVGDKILIAGKRLESRESNSEFKFEIEIPGEYVLLSHDSPATGKLNGALWQGRANFGAGHYVFSPDVPTPEIVLFWAAAFQRGARPVRKGA